MVRMAGAAAGCLVLAACTAGSDPASVASGADRPSRTPAPAPVAGSVLPCGDVIGTDPPPASFTTVLGVVALPASPRSAALQTARSGGGDGPQRLFAKTGLVVRAGTRFELVVPEQGTTRLGIAWGSGPATPSRRVQVPNCPRAGGDGWLAYPGGYWIDRPACVSLVVTADGRQEQVRIGLGTPCPGQRPPQGPSER